MRAERGNSQHRVVAAKSSVHWLKKKRKELTDAGVSSSWIGLSSKTNRMAFRCECIGIRQRSQGRTTSTVVQRITGCPMREANVSMIFDILVFILTLNKVGSPDSAPAGCAACTLVLGRKTLELTGLDLNAYSVTHVRFDVFDVCHGSGVTRETLEKRRPRLEFR